MKSLSLLYCFLILIINNALSAENLKEYLHEQLERDHVALESYRDAKLFVFGHLYLEEKSSNYFIKDLYCGKIFDGENVGPMTIPSSSLISIFDIFSIESNT